MITKVKKTSNTKPEKEYFQNFGILDEIEEINLEEINLEDVNISVTKNRAIFQFNFSLRDDPFCCGLYSVGEFRIVSDTKLIPNSEKISLVKNAFEKLAQISKHKNNREYTLFFTLVNNKPCNYVKEALKDGSLFTLVKSFVNANSGNVNDFYVSN